MIHSVLYAERRATMPRPPKTKALEEALEQLHAAREDVAQAFEGILSQRDLRPIAQALADWRQAAEALKEEAQTVYDDASAYLDERSDTWQESEKGQACNIGVTALEELAHFDP
jgi:DNA-directed RNA polymerase subunit L